MKKSYESPLFEEQKFQFADVISVSEGSGEDDGDGGLLSPYNDNTEG